MLQARRDSRGGCTRLSAENDANAISCHIQIQKTVVHFILDSSPDGCRNSLKENLLVYLILWGGCRRQFNRHCARQSRITRIIEFKDDGGVDPIVELEEVTVCNPTNAGSHFRYHQGDWLWQQERIPRLKFKDNLPAIAIDDFHLVTILNDVTGRSNQHIAIDVVDFDAVGPIILPDTCKRRQSDQVSSGIVIEGIVDPLFQQPIILNQSDIGTRLPQTRNFWNHDSVIINTDSGEWIR